MQDTVTWWNGGLGTDTKRMMDQVRCKFYEKDVINCSHSVNFGLLLSLFFVH